MALTATVAGGRGPEVRARRTLARRVVLSCVPWMGVSVETVELPDGRIVDEFLAVKTRDIAIVVAFTEDRRIVMERSYKHGVRRVALSVPAGYLDNGEDALAAAKRELRDETGYEARDWVSLGTWTVDGNYGICTEHAFIARGALEAVESAHDDLEEIAVELHTVDEVRAALRSGEVAQLSTAGALASALLLLDPGAS